MKSVKSVTRIKQIIYVWNYLEWGGAQIYFLGLIKEIKEAAEIKILLPENSDTQLIKFIEKTGVTYELLKIASDISPAPTLSGKIKRHWKKFQSEFEVVRHLSRFDLNDSIIHIDFAPWQSFFALFYLCTRASIFITMHNSLPEVPKWRHLLWKLKISLITKFDNFFVFPSNEDAKKSLRKFVSQSFYEKTKVTYTNVDPDEIEAALAAKIDAGQLKAKYSIPEDKLLVFCVGQFIDRKGRWTFLEAARNVFDVDRGIAFVWISNSQPSADDLEKAQSFGLGENFIVLTSDQVGKDHIDLFKLLRIADIFALISVQEGLPISLLEAMALGIPSISTKVNAIPEAVKHLETGYLIDSGNARQLTQAFETLKNDGDLRTKLSKNGREFVLANFNQKAVAEIALENYRYSLK